MPFFAKQLNPDAVLIELLRLLGSPVTATEVINELNIHPDYPNLLALNDVLNNFGIESGAYRINSDELPGVPCPFIAHTRKSGTEFLLVKSLDTNTVTVTDQNKKDYKIDVKEFENIFDGVVLVPETNETTLSQNKTSGSFSIEKIRYPLAIALLFIAFIAGVVLHSSVFMSWQNALAWLFKTGGLAVSVLLLIQSIDKNNPLVQTLCRGNNKANCNTILSSKAANVFEGLTWSEVGFFYFAGTWLTLMFSGGSIAMLQILAILNILSLPYTVYSIYYQARVAKQWCVLCCTVQVLLWLEFVPLVISFTQPFEFLNATGWFNLLICMTLPVATWLLLKPLLLKAQQVKPLKDQLRQFKYNGELFNSLLKEQPKYAMPAEEWSIVLGNVEAENIITMVSNPYCPPCAKVHDVLNDWLNHNPDIQARIVFTADNSEKDIKTPVTRHLMALNQLPDKAIVKQALHDWYNQKQKNYEAWAKLYPVQLNKADFVQLDKQKAWCQLAEIKATPTLLVNGYVLPNAYQIKDIKYMLG
ncbi:cysteine peptidase family C39 domain-containing protein [Mucilaginibacter sp.]|jgi:uncharacterized membrane protein|uniref:cysteine peptidase family C39 domain-containing protein n=1 Tax=Mucilaginibacter sp. TaxID=1882438 RepID=UPI003568AFF0